MATNTQLDIIAHLLNQEEPQTIRGIARSLGKSYPLVYNAVRDLSKNKTVLMKSAPPAKIISLNQHAPTKNILDAERMRSRLFLQAHAWIYFFLSDVLRHTKTAYFTLLIFGGYVKKKISLKSDLDILVIMPRKEDIQNMEEVIGGVYTKIKKHFIIVDEEDFISMLSKANQFNVGNEAHQHHVILYGVEEYYQLIGRSRR